jgi:folylpolyglutamate synthase/dihydropteroate synthase
VAEVIPDLEEALERALGMIRRPLVVCGSIFLIGAVRKLLRGG